MDRPIRTPKDLAAWVVERFVLGGLYLDWDYFVMLVRKYEAERNDEIADEVWDMAVECLNAILTEQAFDDIIEASYGGDKDE